MMCAKTTRGRSKTIVENKHVRTYLVQV